MSFVTLRQAVDAMSDQAHYNWCKWALKGLLLDGQLNAYAQAGHAKSYARVASLKIGNDRQGDARRDRWDCVPKEIENDYNIVLPDFTAMEWDAKVPVYEWDWDQPDEPLSIGIGYHFWGVTDWANATLKLEEYQCDDGWREFFRYDQIVEDGMDLRLTYDIELKGLCFQLEEIAAIAPSINFDVLAANDRILTSQRRGAAGRPRKWDWTGAIGAVVAAANTVDGLPEGQGAQAFIERTIADWFMQNTGNQPATSQVREHAQKIMAMLGRK